MKKREKFLFISIGLLTVSLLTGCKKKNFVLYSTNYFSLETSGSSELKKEASTEKKILAYFAEGEMLIPYISVEAFSSMFNDFLAEGYESVVENYRYSTLWTINGPEHPVFAAEFKWSAGAIEYIGNIDSAFKKSSTLDESNSAIFYNANITESILNEGLYNGTTGCSYKKSGFSDVYKGGLHHLPLGVYDICFKDATKKYFMFDYTYIVITSNYKNYLKESKDCYSVIETMQKRIRNYYKEGAPSYYIEYNMNCFKLIMLYYYGLNHEKGIKASTLNKRAFKKDFTNADKIKRAAAYYNFIGALDDDHTLFVGSAAWGEVLPVMPRSQNSINRIKKQKRLTESRKKDAIRGTDVIYFSNTRRTAMFYLDDFEYDTTQKRVSKDGVKTADAYKYDSYVYVENMLKLINENPSVDKVIINISLNGGGYIGVLSKILSLLNGGKLTSVGYYDSNSDISALLNTELIDKNDYLKNKELYLLTSDCSFSCGNALPFYAQLRGLTKIIGEKSGGGECSVSFRMLPNLSYLYHSGTMHITEFVNNSYRNRIGAERRAIPDIEIEESSYFNVDLLESKLEKNN